PELESLVGLLGWAAPGPARAKRSLDRPRLGGLGWPEHQDMGSLRLRRCRVHARRLELVRIPHPSAEGFRKRVEDDEEPPLQGRRARVRRARCGRRAAAAWAGATT